MSARKTTPKSQDSSKRKNHDAPVTIIGKDDIGNHQSIPKAKPAGYFDNQGNPKPISKLDSPGTDRVVYNAGLKDGTYFIQDGDIEGEYRLYSPINNDPTMPDMFEIRAGAAAAGAAYPHYNTVAIDIQRAAETAKDIRKFYNFDQSVTNREILANQLAVEVWHEEYIHTNQYQKQADKTSVLLEPAYRQQQYKKEHEAHAGQPVISPYSAYELSRTFRFGSNSALKNHPSLRIQVAHAVDRDISKGVEQKLGFFNYLTGQAKLMTTITREQAKLLAKLQLEEIGLYPNLTAELKAKLKTPEQLNAYKTLTKEQYWTQIFGWGDDQNHRYDYWTSLHRDVGRDRILSNDAELDYWVLSHPRLHEIAGNYGLSLRDRFFLTKANPEGNKQARQAALNYFRQIYNRDPQKFNGVIPKPVVEAGLSGM